MNRELKKTIAYITCLVLLSAVGTALYLCYRDSLKQINLLEAGLKESRRKEKEATIVHHISKQMEEIAYQQKEISDKRRTEAIRQTHLANHMRIQAEKEQQRAFTAQQEAIQAYAVAEQQKTVAEERHRQAEHLRKVADTLAFLTLGRSLGTLSATQYETGNTELGELLSYSAWKFTSDYKGNVYQPSIINSLILCSR